MEIGVPGSGHLHRSPSPCYGRGSRHTRLEGIGRGSLCTRTGFHAGQPCDCLGISLRPKRFARHGKKLAVLDVIAESDDSLLVASEVGLLRYNLASGTLTATDLVASNEPVYSLARDGKGRLWVLGKELYLIPAGDHRAQVIRGLPVSAENSRLLGTTAAHPSGVVVGLNRRGIVFVETEP